MICAMRFHALQSVSLSVLAWNQSRLCFWKICLHAVCMRVHKFWVLEDHDEPVADQSGERAGQGSMISAVLQRTHVNGLCLLEIWNVEFAWKRPDRILYQWFPNHHTRHLSAMSLSNAASQIAFTMFASNIQYMRPSLYWGIDGFSTMYAAVQIQPSKDCDKPLTQTVLHTLQYSNVDWTLW